MQNELLHSRGQRGREGGKLAVAIRVARGILVMELFCILTVVVVTGNYTDDEIA